MDEAEQQYPRPTGRNASLPVGWVVRHDVWSGQDYFCNVKTGKSIWHQQLQQSVVMKDNTSQYFRKYHGCCGGSVHTTASRGTIASNRHEDSDIRVFSTIGELDGEELAIKEIPCFGWNEEALRADIKRKLSEAKIHALISSVTIHAVPYRGVSCRIIRILRDDDEVSNDTSTSPPSVLLTRRASSSTVGKGAHSNKSNDSTIFRAKMNDEINDVSKKSLKSGNSLSTILPPAENVRPTDTTASIPSNDSAGVKFSSPTSGSSKKNRTSFSSSSISSALTGSPSDQSSVESKGSSPWATQRKQPPVKSEHEENLEDIFKQFGCMGIDSEFSSEFALASWEGANGTSEFENDHDSSPSDLAASFYHVDQASLKSGAVEHLSTSTDSQNHRDENRCKAVVCIKMKKCNKTDLDSFREEMRQNKTSETEILRQSLTVLYGAFLGAEAMHKLGYIHKDIKPKNIFVDQIESGDLIGRLGDFEMCVHKDSSACKGGNSKELGGTVFYTSPEVEQRKAFTESSDIFSLGVCLVRLFMEEGLLLADVLTNLNERHGMATNDKVQSLLNIPSWFPGHEELFELIKDMTQVEPSDRPDISSVVVRLNQLIEKHFAEV